MYISAFVLEKARDISYEDVKLCTTCDDVPAIFYYKVLKITPAWSSSIYLYISV